MKKLLSAFLVICLMFSFALFALASGSDETQSQNNPGEKETAANKPQDDPYILGDYRVEIKSCRLDEDYEGKPVVIVLYGFTNVQDDDAAAFLYALDDSVYQNGVSLNEAYFLKDSSKYSSDNQTKEIKKGASIDVEVAYVLNDTTTEIEVEVTELFSFDNKTVTKTFAIN